jgi:hypothetical protein
VNWWRHLLQPSAGGDNGLWPLILRGKRCQTRRLCQRPETGVGSICLPTLSRRRHCPLGGSILEPAWTVVSPHRGAATARRRRVAALHPPSTKRRVLSTWRFNLASAPHSISELSTSKPRHIIRNRKQPFRLVTVTLLTSLKTKSAPADRSIIQRGQPKP